MVGQLNDSKNQPFEKKCGSFVEDMTAGRSIHNALADVAGLAALLAFLLACVALSSRGRRRETYYAFASGDAGDEDDEEDWASLSPAGVAAMCGGPLPPNRDHCPFDCVLSEWTECTSELCGGVPNSGTQTRSVVRHASNGGKSCPPGPEGLVRACTPAPNVCQRPTESQLRLKAGLDRRAVAARMRAALKRDGVVLNEPDETDRAADALAAGGVISNADISGHWLGPWTDRAALNDISVAYSTAARSGTYSGPGIGGGVIRFSPDYGYVFGDGGGSADLAVFADAGTFRRLVPANGGRGWSRPS